MRDVHRSPPDLRTSGGEGPGTNSRRNWRGRSFDKGRCGYAGAVGTLVDRVSHSKYWATTAIFIIEDDAQDGPDHVDARRTVGLVASPYVKRGTLDSTLYARSSMLRSMELLLGLPPMSQYDAAATPMYASFAADPDLTPYNALPAQVDLNAKNTPKSYGSRASAKMDFDEEDRAPMHLLNEIIWKSVMGAESSIASSSSPLPPAEGS